MEENGTIRELLQQLGLAAVGAVSLTAERADRLADELASRGGMRREEARTIIDDATGRWRGEAVRLGERASAVLEDVFRDLGLVTRESFEELELRVAQLEHRLRLLEPPTPGGNGAPPKP
jgi:polyhydroxyalkanoate synthesis regulator phasin